MLRLGVLKPLLSIVKSQKFSHSDPADYASGRLDVRNLEKIHRWISHSSFPGQRIKIG